MKPGDKVYSFYRYTSDFKIYVVEKIHKNGNFTVEGSKQQYRPDGTRCGDYREVLQLLTDERHTELIAQKEATDRTAAFCRAVDKLHRLNWRVKISQDQLDRTEALVKELCPCPS